MLLRENCYMEESFLKMTEVLVFIKNFAGSLTLVFGDG
jgi:hypothetical protein